MNIKRKITTKDSSFVDKLIFFIVKTKKKSFSFSYIKIFVYL